MPNIRTRKNICKIIVFALILILQYLDIAYSASHNLRPPLKFSEIKIPRIIWSHFDEYGLAIDKEGEDIALIRYQIAIDRIYEWAIQKLHIPDSNINVYGSFRFLTGQLPRLGTYDFMIFPVSVYRQAIINKQTPSDIDIGITINEGEIASLKHEGEELRKTILNELGVWVDFWFSAPQKYRKTIPLSEFIQGGLNRIYQEAL